MGKLLFISLALRFKTLGGGGDEIMRDDAWECVGGLLKDEEAEGRLFLTVVIVTPSP